MHPLADRLLPPQLRSEFKYSLSRTIYGVKTPDGPMFGKLAAQRFTHEVSKARCYFEYGAGGSTVIAAEHCEDVFSVESDRHYARAVQKELKSAGHMNAHLHYIDIGLTRKLGYPLYTQPSEKRIAKWKRYFGAPREILEDPARLDFALVDGRFRVASFHCLLEISIRANHAFVVMFDDFRSRGYYSSILHLIDPDEILNDSAFFYISPNRIKRSPSSAEIAVAKRDPR